MSANYTFKMSSICVSSMRNAIIYANSPVSLWIPTTCWWAAVTHTVNMLANLSKLRRADVN